MLTINEHNHKWWIFAAMCAALSIVFIDQTAISVALPAVQKDLEMTNVMLQWMINAYLVSLAAVVIFGGKLGDILGHKRIFLVGITIFILSSISCAAAQSGLWIIISRAIQGIGGAFMIPVTGVIIANAFKPSERGKAIGLYVGTASIFLSLGPFLSGILIEYFSWRWVFWINVPISLISIALTLIAVPGKEKLEQKKTLDWLGFITLSIFITSLIIALMEGVNWGWNSTGIISLFCISLVFLILFFLVERKAQDPIIYLPLFARKDFLGASLCLLLLSCALSSSVFWAILLQNVMGYSSISTGLFYLPQTVPIMFMAPLGGWLRDKYGPRKPALVGTFIVTAGAFWITFSVFKGTYLALFPGFLLFGLGPALVYSAAMATNYSTVPFSQRGMATGISSGMRQLGSALGVAIIGSVITNIEHNRLLNAFTEPTLKQLTTPQLMSLLSGSESAKKILYHFSEPYLNHIENTLKTTFSFAFSMGMMMAGLLLILAFIACFLLPNKALIFPETPRPTKDN